MYNRHNEFFKGDLNMNKFDEKILVVKRDVLFNDDKNAFHGFLSDQEPKFKAIESTLDTYEVKRRGDMEEDPSYKQLVSYCLLINERDEVLVYERLTGGGETRLHGSMSIGVGGHMNDFSNAGKFKDQMLLVRLKSDILDEDEFATAKIEFGLEIIDQLIERHFE